MKKPVAISFLFSICLLLFTGCDPIYPTGKLKVREIEPFDLGTSADIDILYPNTGGSIVLGWKDQRIDIIQGEDIVTVSDLSVTGIKTGTALIRVSATTVISDEARESGYDEKEYWTEAEITVI